MSEIQDKLKPLLEEFVAKVWELPKEDIKEYAAEISEDFSAYLYKAQVEGDQDAERNLRHLQAQVKLLAAKHLVGISIQIRQTMSEVLIVLAQVARAMLGINLPGGAP